MMQPVMICAAGLFFSIVLQRARPAIADFDSGVAAYKVREYAAALPELQADLRGAHARAQYALSSMYNESKSAALDHALAVEWWRKVAM